MKTHFPIIVAAAVALATLPAVTGWAPFTGTAQAQGASGGAGGGPGGGGPGGAGGGAAGGPGIAGAHGGHYGNDTAAAAVDPSTTGLGKAQAVLDTTPASDEAHTAVATAIAEQEAAGTGQSSSMGFGQALDNMATDVRSALAELFGSASDTANP